MAVTGYRRSIVFVAGLLLLWSAGCDEVDRPPREAEIRALVVEAERLAESRDLEAFRDLISDEYADSRGNNKQSVVLLLNYYFSANRSVHLLTRVAHVSFVDSTHADLLVFVAMAGRPISAETLSGMNADLYHIFASVVEREDGWKISAARWARGWEVDADDRVPRALREGGQATGFRYLPGEPTT